MDPTEQISIRHSEPCPPPSSHHRVHSTPVAISRHHSMPSFACNHWGSEATRRSYKCLLALNKPCPKCIRRRRCTSCCVKADSPKEMIEFWGMFVDISDTYETPLTRVTREREVAGHRTKEAKDQDGNNNKQSV